MYKVVSSEMSTVDKADEEMKNGNINLTKCRFFGNKYEDAIENYQRAGNLYKIAKDWKKAGIAFIKASDCYKHLKYNFDVANSLIEAAKCYEKFNTEETVKLISMAVTYYMEDGKIMFAAGKEKWIAEIYENDENIEKAVEHYLRSIELYELENSMTGNNCKLKVGLYLAQLERYKESIIIYEELAEIYLKNNMLKWSVKDIFFRAGICCLCMNDYIFMVKSIQKYKDMDISFSNQKECLFLEQLLECYDKNDSELFSQIVREYDNILKLDTWKINLLLRIKNNMDNKSLI